VVFLFLFGAVAGLNFLTYSHTPAQIDKLIGAAADVFSALSKPRGHFRLGARPFSNASLGLVPSSTL